jgi:hypothetical protein
MPFKFNCEDCGQPWQFTIRTKGPHRCKSCAERARKEGCGPVQIGREQRDENIGDRIPSPIPQEPLHPITQEAESIDLEIPDAIDGTEFCSTESLIGLQDVARH